MPLLKYAAAALAFASPSIANAQDMPMFDWGPTIQTEAMNSAIDQASRGGSRSRASATRSKPRSAGPSARSRRICAGARDAEDSGSRNPELPRLLQLCSRAGL